MNFVLTLLLLLAVSYTATETQQTEVIFAHVGSPVILPRKLWGKLDKIHVNWYFNDQSLISRNPTSSSPKTVLPAWQERLSLSQSYSLIISPVHASDFGIFKCEQHELLDNSITIYKLYQVTMSTPPPLLVDDSLSLSCEIEREGFIRVPPITVRWLGPDGKTSTGSSNGNKYTYSVSKVSRIHSGKWICEVKYGSHTLQAMTDVVIVDLAPSPPDPIYTFQSSTNFYIPCSLSSKIPWSTVNATGVTGGSWHFTPLNASKSLHLLRLQLTPPLAWKVSDHTENSLMETELKSHELGVKISKVFIKNRGDYTCSLEFRSKTIRSITINRTVRVEVLQVISSANKVIHEGSTVNLTCTLGHPMPYDLEVNWISPHGSSLPNLSPPHPTKLSIPGIRLMDKGQWTCQLKKNGTVLTSATVSLKIEKAPVDIWLVVAITGGALVFILLAVIAVFIVRRRREIMRYRRGKRKFCCCKNPQPKGFYKT